MSNFKLLKSNCLIFTSQQRNKLFRSHTCAHFQAPSLLGSTLRISGCLPPHWVTREGEERFQPFHASQRGCGSAGTSQCDVRPAAPAPRGRNGARPAPAPSDPIDVSMQSWEVTRCETPRPAAPG